MKRKIVSIAAAVALLTGLLAVPVQAVDQDDIEQSIIDGLVWLAGEQDSTDGSWGEMSGREVAETAFVLLKFHTYAVETGQLVDGKIEEIMIDGTDYYPQIEDGLDYLLANAVAIDLSDPDGNSDTYAVRFGGTSIYNTSIAMLAIATSTHPEKTADVTGPSGDISMTYQQVLEDAVDYLVWGQRDDDTGVYRGSWGYIPNSGGDQSNAGYAVLALAQAQASPPYGFGMAIPQVTKDELSIWIDEVQCTDGGSKYTPAWDPTDPEYWENTLKTGNLLFEMAFVGDDTSTQRVIDAIGYIGNHWYDSTLIEGWGWNDPSGPAVAQYQAAYCLMKGLETMGVADDGIPGVDDWYQDLADVIVPQQDVAGYWPSSRCYIWPEGGLGPLSGRILSTVWALLVLERAAPPPSEIEVPVDIKPTSCPNPLNMKGNGVLPVAILGTETFDVTQIDPASVRLTPDLEVDGAAPLRWAVEDVATPYEPLTGKEDCLDCNEFGPDSFFDLTLKFDTQEVVALLGEVEDGDCVVLYLTGTLKEEHGGTAIVGEDVVKIILKKGGKKK